MTWVFFFNFLFEKSLRNLLMFHVFFPKKSTNCSRSCNRFLDILCPRWYPSSLPIFIQRLKFSLNLWYFGSQLERTSGPNWLGPFTTVLTTHHCSTIDHYDADLLGIDWMLIYVLCINQKCSKQNLAFKLVKLSRRKCVVSHAHQELKCHPGGSGLCGYRINSTATLFLCAHLVWRKTFISEKRTQPAGKPRHKHFAIRR